MIDVPDGGRLAGGTLPARIVTVGMRQPDAVAVSHLPPRVSGAGLGLRMQVWRAQRRSDARGQDQAG